MELEVAQLAGAELGERACVGDIAEVAAVDSAPSTIGQRGAARTARL